MKKCGRCAKPAVYHITELREGAVEALHLCESCAKEFLAQAQSAEASSSSESAEPGEERETAEQRDALEKLVCPHCGISFKEFRSQGRLGCPQDYTVFRQELVPLLENIHGEVQHIGKIPQRAPRGTQREFELIRLRSQLKQAVESEEYERAADIRDKIQLLEKELHSPGETLAAGDPEP